MELYNSTISEIEALLPENGSIWDYDAAKCWRDKGSSELVLQKDAAYELGASGKGSANLMLYTSGSSIEKDEVLLYGKDLPSINGDCDFARIVIVKIGLIDGDDEQVYRTLKDIEFAKYHVYPEGYMIRMSPESYREQVRVSKEAVRFGINFRELGNSYIREYKKNENVLACKVIFITDPNFDYTSLVKLAKRASDITNTLTHILEGLPTDCSVCALQGICEEVEGMKELHFGIGDKGSKNEHS